jgi:hypothetical protein
MKDRKEEKIKRRETAVVFNEKRAEGGRRQSLII